MSALIQASFAKGEIGPDLYGRVDTQMYQVALRNARNVIIHPFGGCSNRPGLRFLAPVRVHSDPAPRLIDFLFNTTDKYELEFGNFYMRVLRDDAHVTETDVVISGATQANPCVITAVAHGYSTGDEVYVSSVVGMAQLNGKRFYITVLTADTFSLGNQVTHSSIDSTGYTAYGSGGTSARIYTLVTPYASADLDTLKYTQSADVMTLTHPSYPVQELSRFAHDNWTISPPTFLPKQDFPENITITVIAPAGTIIDRYKVTSLSQDSGEESLAGTVSGNITKTISGATKANPCVVTATSHGFVNGQTVYINSVVGMTQLNGFNYVAQGVTTNTFQLYKYDSTGTILTAVNSTGFTAYSSGGNAASSPLITGITNANPAVVTSTTHSLVNGDEVWLYFINGMTEVTNRRFIAQNVTATTFQLQNEDSTNYGVYTSGGTVAATFIRVTTSSIPANKNNTLFWNPSTGGGDGSFNIYREVAGVFGFIGASTGPSFNDTGNLTPDTSLTPPLYGQPFRLAGDYPGTPGYYEQRRVFGGSTNAPDTSIYSKTAYPYNYTASAPRVDSDAITATMTARQVNEIRHYVPMNDLIVLTSGSEWRVNSGTGSSFTAGTLDQKIQTNWGSSHLRPAVCGSTVLFVQENNSVVRTLVYSLQAGIGYLGGYRGTNMNILAPHLLGGTAGTLTDFCFAQSPEGRLYMTRSDGDALTCTFDEDQQVVAWTHWDTLGSFERCNSLRHAEDATTDDVYFVVKRKINGNTVQYIEKLDDRIFADVRDCFFADCGLTYDNPVTVTGISQASPAVVTAPAHGFTTGDSVDLSDILYTSTFDGDGNETFPRQANLKRFVITVLSADTFSIAFNGASYDSTADTAYVSGGFARKAVTTLSGYDHLEGQAVVALCDGNVVRGMTVTNGSVTLAQPASRAHLGLQYISDMETLNCESPQGTIQGKLTKYTGATIRFKDSRGLLLGVDPFNLAEMVQREDEAMGDPIDLLTGDKYVPVFSDWNRNGRLWLRQMDPLPMTILAIIPDIQSSP